ncbi:MAG: hypothetical protein RIQ56_697 [Candidatus Parcubacteria bacterium]|jgi:hypothetical protein
MANNLPAKLYVWNPAALKAIQGMHPKEHQPPKGNIERYIDALNQALDEYIREMRKRAADRYAAVKPPSPEELFAGVGDSAKKSIRNALEHALASAGFWGGTAMPCPLPKQRENELYVYFTTYAKQPAMVGLTKVKGVSEFPDATGGEGAEEGPSA